MLVETKVLRVCQWLPKVTNLMNSRTINSHRSPDFLCSIFSMTTATQAHGYGFLASTITDFFNPLLSFYSGETKTQKRKVICPDHMVSKWHSQLSWLLTQGSFTCSVGPHMCPGSTLALWTVRTLWEFIRLFSYLKIRTHFEFQLGKQNPVETQTELTLKIVPHSIREY